MKIVPLETKEERNKKENRDDFLDIIDTFRQRFIDGDVNEFVISCLDEEGEVEVYIASQDLVGAVGMFELGKEALFSQYR
jgi:hypothetical protein